MKTNLPFNKKTGAMVFMSVLLTSAAIAGTFTSNVAAGNWNDPAAWAVVGDADGIPDSDDDVTILSGHQITLVLATNNCLNLTIDAGGSLRGTNISRSLNIFGDYTLNGSEVGSYTLGLRKVGGVISGSGTPTQGVAWNFGANTTIDASITVTKNVKCRIVWGKTVTNEGNFTLNTAGQISPDAPTAAWVNGAGGILTLRSSNFMIGAIKDFSTNANSLVIRYTGALPTVTGNQYSSVTINQGTTTLAMDLTCLADLTVNNTGTLTTAGFDIHVEGNFTQAATGALNMSSGDVFFMDGSAAQTMSTAVASSVTLPNLTIDNAAGVSVTAGNIIVTEALDLIDGLLDVSSANAFTLRSDASGTARIAPVASGSIGGNVIVERYIDARADGYSDMASPMSNDIPFTDWDNELLLVYEYNPPIAYPSAYYYDESLWDYVPVTAATDLIKAGQGFFVYLDTDGSPATGFSAATMNSIGTPNIGNVDISGSLTRDNDGWCLVGNPYASFIDFGDFQTASAGTISATWMYYDEVAGDFVSTSGGTIASHQGFWIEVLSVPATATFTESMKDPSNSSTYRNSGNEYFGLRLKSENDMRFSSTTNFVFDNFYSQSYEPGIDVSFKKVPHPDAPSLYTSTPEGKNLRVNVLDKKEQLEIPVYCKAGKSGFYTISVNNIDFATSDGYTCVFLEDKKTGVITNLSSGSYRFYASIEDAEDRFNLRLEKGNCKSAAINEGIAETGIEIFQQTDGTFVSVENEDSYTGVVSVYNPLGQLITEPFSISGEGERQLVKIPVPVDYSGVMVIQVRVNDKTTSKKIFK